MLSPGNIEEKIGFDLIKDKLAQLCATSSGKKHIHDITFLKDKSSIQTLLNQTSQFQNIIRSENNVLEYIHADAAVYLKNIKTPGTFLEPEQFLKIEKALREVANWLKFLKTNREIYSDLFLLTRETSEHKAIRESIQSTIDQNGEIKSSASKTLKKIRSDLVNQRLKARKSLDRLVTKAKSEGITPEDTSLTIRGGRLVIPVKAEHKRSFKGFIHDESSTGSIAYIEPAEVLELNNVIRDLEYQEKREIIRILTTLTDHLRPEAASLRSSFELLGILDFIHARAVLASHTGAHPPKLNEEKKLKWMNARHPILEETHVKQGKKIVPLNIELFPRQRILVISGPNAGGKSVCLKTVGLLQYMLQCGLHIPADEGSESPVFRDMLIDIGDEQSIENDLSTYSSHLKNMATFLHYGNAHSLFLIDEFGSGTDPLFGGAIAEAILEALYKKGMYGLVTTHYGNLKKMAEDYPEMANARMRFDVEHLEPLFQLETGKPGSSFSLEIAGKIGLPPEILKKARNSIGSDQVDMERLLNELEVEKKYFEDKNQEIRSKQKLLDTIQSNYEDLKKDLELRKKKILNEAKEEALRLLKITNKRTENLIRQIRENKAEKEATKALRDEMKKFEGSIVPEPMPETPVPKLKIIKGRIRPGDKVRVKGQSVVGEVDTIEKNKAIVIFGNMKTKTALSRLEKIGIESVAKKPKKNVQRSLTIKGIDLNDKMASFTSELDLRGKRGEVAQVELVRFLDEAMMLGIPSARIIHGKGTGILRRIVHEELSNRKEIKKIEYEHADRGGDGVTIITF